MTPTKNDSNGHPYCDQHFNKEGIMCRAVEDIDKIEESVKSSIDNLHQRVDAVACRARELVDASDRASSTKHGDIYKVMRELEKTKMSNRTFWGALTIIICILVGGMGIVITVQSEQIKTVRTDQIAASNGHAEAMEDFTYKLGGKLDDIRSDVGSLNTKAAIFQNDINHTEERLKEHENKYHKAPWGITSPGGG